MNANASPLHRALNLSNPWLLLSLALLVVPLLVAAQTPSLTPAGASFLPRTNINPALLYWQAYALLPDLSEEENRRASDRNSARQDAETGDLVARFDASFKILRRARSLSAPCDWGVDLSLGPEAMLPQLAKAKRLAQASTFRANYFLSTDREMDAREDLLAALVLGRHVSADHILVSSLVQIAIENIILTSVAENFYRFSDDSLRAFRSVLENGPPAGTISQCVRTEKFAFVEWYARKISDIRQQYPNDDAQAMAEVRAVFNSTVGEMGDTTFTERLVADAGGTPAGLISYLQAAGQYYDRLAALAALPYEQYQREIAAVTNNMEKGGNLWDPLESTCRHASLSIL